MLTSAPDRLPAIESWIAENRFSLNYSKTKQMLFIRSGRPGTLYYPHIELVTNLKILGVLWNNSFTWDKHFENVMKCCSQRLYVIRVLKSILPKPKLVCVYHALITSLLFYAAPLFSWLPTILERKLEKFQNRGHRIICGSHCNCIDFPTLYCVRERRASTCLKSCETFPNHPLHEAIPNRLPRTGDFCRPVSSTYRRLHAFIPWTCQRVNSGFYL